MSIPSDSLIIGMPAGSLADPKRGGNLIKLLENAGFMTSGYDTGGPSKFTSVNFLFGWDGRPQEFGSQLSIQEMDAAIAGDDWIMERQLELKYEYNTDVHLEKVLSLKRGNVRIVGIANRSGSSNVSEFISGMITEKEMITAVSEMPYITINWLRKILDDTGLLKQYNQYSVQKYKTPPKINKGIVVYETWGKTESKVKNGGADIGLEITQSGNAIRNYGLSIIDTVMESETGIWINPVLKKNSRKAELMRMFLINLYGCVNAENKVMILFNVKNEQVPQIESYLRKNNLFADEPTVNTGKVFSEFSIQVDRNDRELPLAKIRYELAQLKAVNINTIPIDSSIPNLDILGL
jgi:ATP phosphoribosyltransferase